MGSAKAMRPVGSGLRLPRLDFYQRLVRPALFRTDPEWTHDRSVRAAEVISQSGWVCQRVDRHLAVDDARLATAVSGLQMRSPLGLAAGYDKNARATPLLSSLGFGHVEIGSVSAYPSAGNPAPRLWRVPADEGIVVYYGVPNEGAERVRARLADRPHPVPVGVNIVNTNRGPGCAEESVDAIIEDYRRSVSLLQHDADYLCINLSCPNTRDGQGFFHHAGRLDRLLDVLADVGVTKPLFLKVAPFAEGRELESFLAAADGAPYVSGFSINLPPGKPPGLRTPAAELSDKPGAVSGPACRDRADRTITALYRAMNRDRYTIIGSGGVVSGADAYRKIRLGATLVQLYTTLIYQGPGAVHRITRELAELAARDGLTELSEAVGMDAYRH
jgi:dihydroorotate dehydrogenase (fumarate)/dihydroorotate dehydrogenase